VRKLINLDINPLNAELNPTCHLLALLEAHHILHFSRIRVKKEIISKREIGKSVGDLIAEYLHAECAEVK